MVCFIFVGRHSGAYLGAYHFTSYQDVLKTITGDGAHILAPDRSSTICSTRGLRFLGQRPCLKLPGAYAGAYPNTTRKSRCRQQHRQQYKRCWGTSLLGDVVAGRRRCWEMSLLGDVAAGGRRCWETLLLGDVAAGVRRCWETSLLGDVAAGGRRC